MSLGTQSSTVQIGTTTMVVGNCIITITTIKIIILIVLVIISVDRHTEHGLRAPSEPRRKHRRLHAGDRVRTAKRARGCQVAVTHSKERNYKDVENQFCPPCVSMCRNHVADALKPNIECVCVSKTNRCNSRWL